MSKKMQDVQHVVVLTDYVQGGLWRVILSQIEGLVEKHYPVSLMAFSKITLPKMSNLDRVVRLPALDVFFPLGFLAKLFFVKKTITWFLPYITANNKRTLFVATDPWYILIVSLLGYKQVIYLYQGNTYTSLKSWRDFNYRQIFLRLIQRVAMMIVTATVVPTLEEQRKVRAMLFGIRSKRVMIAPNGVGRHFFSKKKRLTGKLAFLKHQTPLVYAGRISVDKGLQGVLRVFEKVSKEYTGAVLVFAYPSHGVDADLLKRLHNEAFSKKISDRIFWLPDLTDFELAQLYSIARMTVLFSEREFAPLSLLESLASGTPMVATRVGNCESVLRTVDLRLTVAVGDEDDLYHATRYVFSLTDAKYFSMRRRCHKIAKTYSIERSRQVFQEILFSH